MAKAQTVLVYDLDNKPHQMTPANARDMIQHMNWTTQPVDRKALAKAQQQRDADVQASTSSDFDSSSIEQELNGKSKAEMVALALERYGEKLDGRKSEADIITAIIELAQLAAAGKLPETPEDEDEDDDQGAAAGEPATGGAQDQSDDEDGDD